MATDKIVTAANASGLFNSEKKISVKEFKMWLTGYIQGLDGKVPTLQNWEVIKQMLDRVQEEPQIVEKYIPTWPSTPAIPAWPTYPPQPFWVSPHTTGSPPPGLVPSIWCSNNNVSYTATSTTALTQCGELSDRLRKDSK